MTRNGRTTQGEAILKLSQVKTEKDAQEQEYRLLPYANGYVAKSNTSVEPLSQYDLGKLGFTITVDEAPSFDHLDSKTPSKGLVRSVLNRLLEASKLDTRLTHRAVPHNYQRLLNRVDGSISPYSSQEYLSAIHNPSYRDVKNKIIVKHPSEWYHKKDDPFWLPFLNNLTKDAPEWKEYSEAYLDKMVWMQDASELKLNSSLWHMHPVEFLGALSSKNEDRCKVLFLKVSDVILRHEGGYINNPDDKGGETNLGITLDTWRFLATQDLGIKASSETLKSMTKSQAETIYYNHYWQTKGFCKLENTKIALMIYDWTITSGLAIKQIRKCLHNECDSTLSVSNKMDDDIIHCVNNIDDQEKLLNRIAEIRKDYYLSLTVTNGKPNAQVKFLGGWLKRVDGCLQVTR